MLQTIASWISSIDISHILGLYSITKTFKLVISLPVEVLQLDSFRILETHSWYKLKKLVLNNILSLLNVDSDTLLFHGPWYPSLPLINPSIPTDIKQATIRILLVSRCVWCDQCWAFKHVLKIVAADVCRKLAVFF